MSLILWTLLGVTAGACISVQAPINAELAKGLGSPIAAAAISFLAGSVVLVGLAWLTVTSGHTNLNWQAPAVWMFAAGGLLGSVFVTSTILLTPVIGAAAVMALAITGQLLMGLALDRVGFLGLAVRELTLGRAAGAVLLISGALMVRYL